MEKKKASPAGDAAGQAEEARHRAEQQREVRDQHREALELIRQAQERERESGEVARAAGEHARVTADVTRGATVEAVAVTADTLKTTVEQTGASRGQVWHKLRIDVAGSIVDAWFDGEYVTAEVIGVYASDFTLAEVTVTHAVDHCVHVVA